VETDILLREFDVSKCHVPDDWYDWLKKTSHQLLKQNPSPILYACSTLTEVYAPLASELYNIAFVICWKNLSDNQKQTILDNYLQAKNAKIRPPRVVLLTILNLAEFIELDECYCFELKIFEAKTLAIVAEKCNAYAKALYYWE
jgi:FKBP12-rapamycin complex-associated protein